MSQNNGVTAWSFSRYETYQQCPLKFKKKVIEKAKEPQSPAMARGDTVHKGTAAYVTQQVGEMPAEIKLPFQRELVTACRSIAAEDKQVEQQWGFTQQWRETGWFGKDTWFRNILDFATVYEDLSAEVLDWKTGARRSKNEEQMELNALSLFLKFKPATHVTTRMVYFDAGSENVAEFDREEVPALLAKWGKKIEPMFNDTVFAARPNDMCRFCHFGRSKGGDCRHG
jgi:hypothetical protein